MESYECKNFLIGFGFILGGSREFLFKVRQCFGSGMFIPDPTVSHPGSEFFPSRNLDPHQRI